MEGLIRMGVAPADTMGVEAGGGRSRPVGRAGCAKADVVLLAAAAVVCGVNGCACGCSGEVAGTAADVAVAVLGRREAGAGVLGGVRGDAGCGGVARPVKHIRMCDT